MTHEFLRDMRKLLVVFSVWSLLAWLNANSMLVFRSAVGRPIHSYWFVVFSAFRDYWVWAALTPAVFWLARRFQFSRDQILRPLLAHFLGFLAYSWIHTSLAVVLHVWSVVPDDLPFGKQVWLNFLGNVYYDLWMYFPLVAIWQMLNYHHRYRTREADLMKAQLQLLRMQMQPHFLFNTLNSISALIESEPAAAEEMIADLSFMLRISLKEGARQEVPLREELEIVNAYLRIQGRRLGPRLRTEIVIEPEVLDALVPGMLLQPLVENAIIHGIQPSPATGTVEIRAARKNGRLRILVRDDGLGLPADYQEGLGLANIRKRLSQLYGEKHLLRLGRAPGSGTEIEVHLPCRDAGQVSLQKESYAFAH